MPVFARAGCAVALLLAAIFAAPIASSALPHSLASALTRPAAAADKPYHRDELDDQAIRLEGQLRKDVGALTKNAATLRREADAAIAKRDHDAAARILSQLVVSVPTDSDAWLKLARATSQVLTHSESDRMQLRSRATAAAYIAYQRASARNDEASALALLSELYADRKMWRPALDTLRFALDLRDDGNWRERYDRLREDYGFRMLDYSVDADAASPRACFQFSEPVPAKRVDFSPYIAVGGIDKPALSAEDKQICVEGLKHGERYTITLRPGLPSSVRENLLKSAEVNLYVRDRKPFVRFAAKAFVLPRTGQRGIPVVTVNTREVAVEIYRVGDRNLIETVLGGDFQRNLDTYEFERLASERGAKVWTGQLAVESTLNADVTTAFPVDQAVGDLAPGVYVMAAKAKGSAAEGYEALATQWFVVSDLGLSAFSGNDGVHAFVHSLASTSPTGEVEVRLIARNNEVLATRRTDATGHVHFEPGLTRGEGGLTPALLVATAPGGKDYAFLNLKGPAFDLSDRGVAGRPVPAGLDAFVYTERGVYRSGEQVHVMALLRDAQGVAAAGVPLTLVVDRPDGVEYRRAVIADQGEAGHYLNVPINAAAPSGTWRVRAYTDPKRPPVGEVTFLVEDYVPDRLEFELSAPQPKLSKDAAAELKLAGRYLYGAPAANLDLEGEVVVGPAKERPGLAGYVFGLSDEEVAAERQPLSDLPQTDDDGNATFSVTLDKLPAVTKPLEATVTVRLAEAGGRAVERSLTLPIVPAASMIGVKPLFGNLGEGENASFDVVMVAPDGKRLARKGLRYELVQLETRYQWYRHDNNWNYEPIKLTRRVADGQIDLSADAPARLNLPVRFGRYRLEISTDDPNGPVTSMTFNSGWYAEATADTPDMLELALDKTDYRPGETMTVAVTARAAGRVTLNVVGNKFVTPVSAEVPVGVSKLTLTVGTDWGNGAYLVATLRRPLDEQAQRMPGRSIGVHWFAIDKKAHTLDVALKPPGLIRPETTLRIPVKIDGLVAGEEARITIAAVDVGILNLTNYKPPAPDTYFLGQRAMTAELRDLYGQLIDGMQGTRGQIRTGGDESPKQLSGSPPVQKPLALFSGIVTVKADGTAEVSFDIPGFAGTARLMAVAWTKDKVGRANTDVVIRDPVVVTSTLPRFLRNGDVSQLRLDIDNVDGAAGDYRIAVRTEGPVNAGVMAQPVRKLAAKKRDSVIVPISATAAGPGKVIVEISGPEGFTLARAYALEVNPATQILTRRTVKPIAGGESLTLSKEMFADLVPGTGAVAVSVGLSTALDAATILRALDRYPYGCSEQTVSRALPLLYVNELATSANLAMDANIDDRLRAAIDKLLARQGANGSFGLWSVGGDDPWLDAYVTDFLSRARERGFAVPDVAFKLALDRLRNFVGSAEDVSKTGGISLAYALYVLARNGNAPIGDLRYLADAKLADVSTPIAKAQLAAALGMLGDKARAERVYAAALRALPERPFIEFGRRDYGSMLRDAAALVTLAAEGNAPKPTVFSAVARIEAARNLSSYTTTQENSWLVLAARAIARDADKVSLRIGGEDRQGVLFRTIPAAELANPLGIANTGDTPLQAVISVTGAPQVAEPAAERGFKIERQTFTLEGEAVDIGKLKQNQRVVVVLKITEPKPDYGRIIVADHLPAGLEIDNPRLVSSGDTGTLSWIQDAVQPAHAEFRDDRFTAAFNRNSGDRTVFSVAYVARAVSPGRYVLPQALVEDMYQPDRFGRTGTGTIEVTAAK